MRQRILTGILICIAVFFPLYYGGLLFKLLLTFIISVGGYELYRVNKKKWPPILLVIMIFFLLAIGFLDSSLSLALISVYLIILFTVSVGFEWFDTYDLSYVFMTTTMLGLAVNAAVQITNTTITGRMPIFYIVLVTVLATDSGAYFGGTLFGKHKLAPRISPNKTIEGSITGYFFGLAVSLLFGLLVMVPRTSYTSEFIVIASVLMPIVGQLGDLAFSSIKRYYKIKDFGFIFPGHGGVLDRIDSVVFNLLLFNFLLVILG